MQEHGRCGRAVDMADMVKWSLIVLWSHSIKEYYFFLTKIGMIWSFSKESYNISIGPHKNNGPMHGP